MINCILIGPQGSGKGTQAEMIVQKYGLTHIETGLMIRKRAQYHDKKAELMNHLTNKMGILLPDGIILDMIFNELAEKPSEKGYLFDGFPRTVKQYESLKELLNQKNQMITTALYLNISDKEAIKRISSRRLCPKCGKGYSILSDPSRIVCDCGGILIKRIDDEPDIVSKRLELFHKTTQPILELMKKDGILSEFNGQDQIYIISDNISKILDKYL